MIFDHYKQSEMIFHMIIVLLLMSITADFKAFVGLTSETLRVEDEKNNFLFRLLFLHNIFTNLFVN